MRNFLDVPIPPMMRHLDVDPRGYPIPENVFRGPDGKPHFTINDTATRVVHLRENRCPICGKGLHAGYWFVGGPRSAFHEHGAYNDIPMHHQCMEYALRVCPYLAAPNYARRIDGKTLRPSDHKQSLIFQDITQIPDRPTLFVAVLSTRRHITPEGYVRPGRPYKRIEYWQHGEPLDPAEGRRLCEEIMKQPVPELQRPRLVRR